MGWGRVRSKLAIVLGVCVLVAAGAVTAVAMTTPLGDQILPGPSAPPVVEDSTSASDPRGSVDGDATAGEVGSATGVVTNEPPAGTVPGLVPDTAGLTDTVPNLNETVGNATQTVDSLLHEVESAANGVAPLPPLPAVPVDLPVQLPEVPAPPTPPLPTPPPLPGLP